MIRSWRPNLSETTRKDRARASRVHHDLRRPKVVSRGLGSSFGVPGGVVGSLDPSVGRESEGSGRGPPGGRSALGRLAPPVAVGTSGSRTIDAEPGVDRGPGDEPLAAMCGCASSCRERTHQPVARIRPLSPERDARVTTPSPGMFAAPPMTQPVGASRTAFSGRFASTAVEDVASHPNRLSRCARRSDDTDARKATHLSSASGLPTALGIRKRILKVGA